MKTQVHNFRSSFKIIKNEKAVRREDIAEKSRENEGAQFPLVIMNEYSVYFPSF